MRQSRADIERKLFEIENELSKLDIRSSNLIGGDLGITLFNFNYYLLLKQDKHLEKVINQIQLMTSFNLGKNATLCNGLAGYAWLLNYFYKNELIDTSINSYLKVLEEYLLPSMLRATRHENYDFLHGGGGIAWYFLSRLPNNEVKSYLSRFIDALYSTRIECTNGTIKWKSQIGVNRIEGFNISLSHGIASLIVILSKLLLNGINPRKTKFLLNGAVEYILQQKLANGKFISIYPSLALESSNVLSPSRLGWCYGDLGIAISLWHAANATHNELWKQEAINTFLHSAKRRILNENMVEDAGLCHGCAGIAHIFNRMYISTKVVDFKDAADFWISKTLDKGKFGDGLAGYKFMREGNVSNEISILEGIAGIGLALMSYLDSDIQEWDECLLMI